MQKKECLVLLCKNERPCWTCETLVWACEHQQVTLVTVNFPKRGTYYIHVYNPKKVYWDTEGISGQNEMYILSDNKAGKVAVDLEIGVVLYSDLLDGVVYQKPKPKPKQQQQSVHNNTQLMSAEQNNTTTVESDPSAPAKQAPNLSTTETVQPNLPAKKKMKKVNKKQYVVDKKNVCWLPKRIKVVDKSQHKVDGSQHLPTHYTSLEWIVAFGEYMFDGNMELAKKNDPVFGPGSYGHIYHLVPEHLFVMEKQLETLRNDG
jgi:hypothetical protein